MMTDLSDRKGRLIRLCMHQMRKGRHDAREDEAYAWDDIIQKDTLYTLCKGTAYELKL